jgi:dUTPase
MISIGVKICLCIGDIIRYQLFSAERKVVPAHGKALVDTQLSIAVPPGTYGRVAPRSGLGLSYKIEYNNA